MYQGLQQTLGEVLTISDAELDGLLDCGDEVIDQLSELSSLIITLIILLLETPCPSVRSFVRWFVTFFTPI